MFWGLIMEPQRRYTQQVKKSFHISMAALDISTSSDEPAQVMCGFEGRNYLLCTLKKPDLLQCPLDLSFDVGSEVSFAANGKCHVHLTGYLNDPDESDSPDPEEPETEEEEEEQEEEQEVNNVTVKSKKRSKKLLENGPPSKKLKKNANVSSTQNDNENSDSDDSDFDVTDVNTLLEDTLDDSDDDSDAVVDEDAEEEESEDDEDELEEEEEDSSLSENESEGEENEKKLKSKINGVAKKKEQESPKQKKDKKKEKQIEQNKKLSKGEQKKEVKTPNKEIQASRKKVLQGGVIIEDIREGQGAPAKSGKIVNVYYEGKLKQNNRVFDSTSKGAGFSFRLGAGDVIKGWDVGVLGMKPGGKRRIICPASMAYGQKGSPPAIPPNATLVFEVELRKCN